MNWGYVIKQLREEAHMTQQELADKSGLGRSHLSNIEGGRYKTYKPEVIERIARGLDKTTKQVIDYIYGRDEDITREGRGKYLKEIPEELLEWFRGIMHVTVPIYEKYPFQPGESVEPIDHIAMTRKRATNRKLEAYVMNTTPQIVNLEGKHIFIIDRQGPLDIGNTAAYLYNERLNLGQLRRIADEIFVAHNKDVIKPAEVQTPYPVVEIRSWLK